MKLKFKINIIKKTEHIFVFVKLFKKGIHTLITHKINNYLKT